MAEMEQYVNEANETDPTIKLGVLGCGHHSVQSHLTQMDTIEGVTLNSAFDPSQEAIEKLDKLGIAPLETFRSEEEVLLSPIDALLVMSPDEFHAESLRNAVRAGKHVFVEKPLATNTEQLDTVCETLEQAKQQELIITSCHPRRFDPPYVWLKENLVELEERYGSVLSFDFDFSYHTPVKEWKHDRGLLLDHANHEIDLVNWYFGMSSFEAWRLSDTPTEYRVVGKREDGITFSFRGNRKLDSFVYREFMSVRFQRATLTLDTNGGVVRIQEHESGESRQTQIPSTDYTKRFQAVNDNFIQTIHGEAENYLSLDELYVNTALSVKLTENERWVYDGTWALTAVQSYDDIPWLPSGSSIELHKIRSLPPRNLITSMHALCFSGDQLLMVKHRTRGWDIPGGHVDPGEDAEQALERELTEEASATAKELRPFAMLKTDIPQPPSDYNYPSPHSYICFFTGKVDTLDPFPADFETEERQLMLPEEVRKLDWYKKNAELYELALSSSR